MTITVRVTFSDGGQLVTAINTDLAGAREYYIGREFNVGITSDRMATGIRVDAIPAYSVRARAWFDKVNGNTYFSARIYDLHGDVIAALPFQYGYGSQYIYEAVEWLVSAGLIPRDRTMPVSDQVRDDGAVSGLKRDAVAWGTI